MLVPPFDVLLVVLIAPFIGSFLGLVATRLPQGESIVAPRSHCRTCGRTLGPLELIPLVSWIVLANRCGGCRAPIGLFFPAIELAAVAIAVWASFAVDGSLLWPTVLLGWALLTLAAMDVRSFILADAITMPLVAAGLAVTAYFTPSVLWLHVAGAAAGFLLMVAVARLYLRWRGREGLGLGDAKFMAAAGAWTGLDGLGSVLLYAAVSGLCAATLMRIRGELVDSNTAIPLGSGIAIGFWLVWLYGPFTVGA